MPADCVQALREPDSKPSENEASATAGLPGHATIDIVSATVATIDATEGSRDLMRNLSPGGGDVVVMARLSLAALAGYPGRRSALPVVGVTLHGCVADRLDLRFDVSRQTFFESTFESTFFAPSIWVAPRFFGLRARSSGP